MGPAPLSFRISHALVADRTTIYAKSAAVCLLLTALMLVRSCTLVFCTFRFSGIPFEHHVCVVFAGAVGANCLRIATDVLAFFDGAVAVWALEGRLALQEKMIG